MTSFQDIEKNYSFILIHLKKDEINSYIHKLIVDIDVNKRDIKSIERDYFYKNVDSTILKELYKVNLEYWISFWNSLDSISQEPEEGFGENSWDDEDEITEENIEEYKCCAKNGNAPICDYEKIALKLFESNEINKTTIDIIHDIINPIYKKDLEEDTCNADIYIDGFLSNFFNFVKETVIEKIKDRKPLIYKKGEYVDKKQCEVMQPLDSVVEFCVDGQWGLMDNSGQVLLENVYDSQFSKLSKIRTTNDVLVKVQNAASSKIGIISLTSYSAIIPCVYDVIHLHYLNDSIFFIINTDGIYEPLPFGDTMYTGGKYGLFSSEGTKLLDVKYDSLVFKGNLIECDNCVYDLEGKLLVGGYSSFEIQKDYLLFYFNLYDNRYEDSFCVILDKTFHFLLPYQGKKIKFQIGKVVNSLHELFSEYPESILLRLKVDLSHIDVGYILLTNPNGHEYITEELLGYEVIKKEYGNFFLNVDFDQFCLYEYGRKLKHYPILLPIGKFPDYIEPVWVPRYNQQDEAIILKIDKNNNIQWSFRVEDIGYSEHFGILYFKDNKVGFIRNDIIYSPMYVGVTIDSNFVARAFPDEIIGNGDYFSEYNETIQFYVLEGDKLISGEDYLFKPNEHSWFPKEFYNKYQYYFNEGEDDAYYDDIHSTEWTDEDAWDAMTDGMYGDYPGPGWDPEMFGY